MITKQFLQKLQVLRSLIQRQVTYIKRIDFFPDLYGLNKGEIEVWEEISQHKTSFLDPKYLNKFQPKILFLIL